MGVGCHFLLQAIFPFQESNPGLQHCKQILYQLSYAESPQTPKSYSKPVRKETLQKSGQEKRRGNKHEFPWWKIQIDSMRFGFHSSDYKKLENIDQGKGVEEHKSSTQCWGAPTSPGWLPWGDTPCRHPVMRGRGDSELVGCWEARCGHPSGWDELVQGYRSLLAALLIEGYFPLQFLLSCLSTPFSAWVKLPAWWQSHLFKSVVGMLSS